MGKQRYKVGLIWATDEHGTFSKDGNLPWHDTEYKPVHELKHFKEVTQGATVVMGRKTWKSLPFKPLKGRKNVIISSTMELYQYDTDISDETISEPKLVIATSRSLEEALMEEQDLGNDVWIIGGRKLLLQGFNYAEHLWHTTVNMSGQGQGESLRIDYGQNCNWEQVGGVGEGNWISDYWKLKCLI